MRKAFRMRYEPCNGECYVGTGVVQLDFLRNDRKELKRIVQKMVRAHDYICGNEAFSYGMDYDDEMNIFISSFLHTGKIDLFSSKTSLGCLDKLCDAAITHFDSSEGKAELEQFPGKGHSVCHHGQDEDLIRFMIKHSGIETPDGVDRFVEEMLAA